MDLILQVFYSVFSSVLLGLALPNEAALLGIPFITLFALVPFYIAFSNIKNYKQALLLGFIQPCVTHIISSFWLAYFKDYAIVTLGASAFGTGLIGAGVFLFLYVPYSSLKSKNILNSFSFDLKYFDSPLFRVLYFASIYTIYEWAKSVGFLGYPWGTMTTAIYKWHYLMQLASITGTYGITWLLALANAIIAEFIIQLKKGDVYHNVNNFISLQIAERLLVVLFAVTIVHGIYQYHVKRVPEKTLTAIMVQQNSDPWKEETDEESILNSMYMTDDLLLQLHQDNKEADLIVWSEGTLKYHFPNSEGHYTYYPTERPLSEFVEEKGIPLLTGGAYTRSREKQIYFNAAIMYDAEGKYRGYYGKNHLVPMAEAIPGMEIPVVKQFMAKVIGISAGWTPGDQYVYFNVPGKWNKNRPIQTVQEFDLSQSHEDFINDQNKKPLVKIATPICYDDAFPDIMRPLFLNGAELFVNLTDDSWSLKKSSEYQHYIVSTYRAIEYRTPLVRSTNAGCSVVIDANGKTLTMLPLFEMDAMSYEIPVYKRTMTTYARFGNWLPRLLLLCSLSYVLFCVLTFKKTDYIPSERKNKNLIKRKKNKKNKK